MNYMFNNKEKWQRFTDWKGWKWVYYLKLVFFLFVAIYSLGSTIFFSIYKDYSLSGKTSPADMVFIGLVVFIPCLISLLSALFIKISNHLSRFRCKGKPDGTRLKMGGWVCSGVA